MSIGIGSATPSAFDAECELCEAAKTTEWFFEDEVCWVAECEACGTPMVVWKRHDPTPPEEIRAVLLDRLNDAVTAHYRYEHRVDENMRSIPTHYHAHARPRGAFYGHGQRRA